MKTKLKSSMRNFEEFLKALSESYPEDHWLRESLIPKYEPFIRLESDTTEDDTRTKYHTLMLWIEMVRVAQTASNHTSVSFSLCESPIEQQMLLGLLAASLEFSEETLVITNEHQKLKPLSGYCRLLIEPQAAIGKFRVDFKLTYQEAMPDPENIGGKDEPKSIYGFKIESTEIIIECDGHDFHERTKEQASKDRSRDRALQQLGFKILRFTGSEIHKNPGKCAREALKFFHEGIDT